MLALKNNTALPQAEAAAERGSRFCNIKCTHTHNLTCMIGLIDYDELLIGHRHLRGLSLRCHLQRLFSTVCLCALFPLVSAFNCKPRTHCQSLHSLQPLCQTNFLPISSSISTAVVYNFSLVVEIGCSQLVNARVTSTTESAVAALLKERSKKSSTWQGKAASESC